MSPVALELDLPWIGQVTVAWYGLISLAGVLGAVVLGRREILRLGLMNRRQSLNAGLILASAAFVGGHLLFLVTPGKSAGSLRSGSVLYGAIFAAAVAAIVVARVHRISPLRLLDAIAPAGVLPPLIGRFGCYTAGCCYGTPTDLPWGVTFEHPAAAAPAGVALHPTQLYEAAALTALFALLWWRRKRVAFTGELVVLYLGLYSVARFAIETVRGDDVRGFVFGGALSFSQAIAIPSVVIAVAAYAILRRRGRDER